MDTIIGCTIPAGLVWEHRIRFRCGYDVVALTLGILLGKIPEDVMPPGKGPKSLLPKDMGKLIEKYDRSLLVQPFQVGGNAMRRIEFLISELQNKRPVPIMTYGRGWFAPHWILVLAYNHTKRVFYVYDPRPKFSWNKNGTATSSDPKLPVGNREVTPDELLSLWRGCFWDRFRKKGKFSNMSVPIHVRGAPLPR